MKKNIIDILHEVIDKLPPEKFEKYQYYQKKYYNKKYETVTKKTSDEENKDMNQLYDEIFNEIQKIRDKSDLDANRKIISNILESIPDNIQYDIINKTSKKYEGLPHNRENTDKRLKETLEEYNKYLKQQQT